MTRLLLPLLLAPMLVVTLPASAAPARVTAAPPEVNDIPVALLVDLGSGRVLLEKRAELRFVPASMAKVMTAYVAFELIAQRQLRIESQYRVTEATARTWNGRGTSLTLKGGEQLTVDSLLNGITIVSANDAAMVLAEGFAGSVPAWTSLMNAQARRLGMKDSHFATPNGWPDNGATYVSARDLVTLSRAMVTRHPALYRRYFGRKQMVWHGVPLASRDPTIGIVPGADGIKTGHTAEAGFNFLGSAVRDHRRLVMVVAGAKSEEARARASRAILEWGYSAWQARRLFAEHGHVGEARVQGGDARHVGLVAPHALFATFPAGETAPVSLRIIYKGPLPAPIIKGSEVAELEIRTGDGPLGRVPLLAASSVGKAGWLDRLVNGVMGLFS